jgi:hypothetical protein
VRRRSRVMLKGPLHRRPASPARQANPAARNFPRSKGLDRLRLAGRRCVTAAVQSGKLKMSPAASSPASVTVA